MYALINEKVTKIDTVTFASLKMKESKIEEILRNNIELIVEDDESLLIIGQQVSDSTNKRSDLIAIDSNGNLVLIEIKRDKQDIESRKEAFEIQAIRYAASCATIEDENQLIQIYSKYIEKHRTEYENAGNLTTQEIAKREFEQFKNQNNINQFNAKQRIILVASNFDEQTLSAVAWLNSNNVDISCYQICPYLYDDHIFIEPQKILPVVEYDDFYVSLNKPDKLQKKPQSNITKRVLPRIDKLLEWNVVYVGDILIAKGSNPESRAILQESGKVKVNEDVMSILAWLKSVYHWSNVDTYKFTIQEKTNKTLYQLRAEKMEKMEKQDLAE